MRVLFGKTAVALLLAAVSVIGLAYYILIEASGHSANRSFSSSEVEPGGELVVTIETSGLDPLGVVVGLVDEFLPPGFTYTGSSLPASAVERNGQIVTFHLAGVASFTYQVTAPMRVGDYFFSGSVTDASNPPQGVPVCGPIPDGCDRQVTVSAPVPTPTATPVATATTVPTPDATPVATPTTVPTPDTTPVATATTVPTPDTTPVATATIVPTPSATPVATPTTVPTPVPTATQTPIPQPSSGVGFTVSGGGAHYCALHSTTGSILCWGANEHGQASPPRTGRYTAIVSGDTHSCAIRSDGALVCWGSITVNP